MNSQQLQMLAQDLSKIKPLTFIVGGGAYEAPPPAMELLTVEDF